MPRHDSDLVHTIVCVVTDTSHSASGRPCLTPSGWPGPAQAKQAATNSSKPPVDLHVEGALGVAAHVERRAEEAVATGEEVR